MNNLLYNVLTNLHFFPLYSKDAIITILDLKSEIKMVEISTWTTQTLEQQR